MSLEHITLAKKLKMKKLKYKKCDGLHIVCKGCGRNIELTQTPYKGCEHPIEKQRYKGLFRINGERRTKDLKSKEYNEAVLELAQWKIDLDNPIKISIPQTTKETQVERFEDWIWIYSDWLQNVDVPFHEQKHRSEKYIKDRVTNLMKFKKFLDANHPKGGNIPIVEIDKNIFGKFYEHVGKTASSAAGFNHTIKAVKYFFNFVIDERKLLMQHPCKKAKLKYESPNPVSIDDKDFIKLLSVVNEQDCLQTSSNGKIRNRYRPWMREAFELSAYTGMRNEEVASLKYSDIITDSNGKLEYLSGIDLKYERKHNWDNTQAVKIVPIPITPELEDLLIRLNYKENIGSVRYLIDGDCVFNRKSLAVEISKAFTFFKNKAGIEKKFSLKHLRKTFLTKMETKTGLVKSAGYQKNASVIEKNYLDKIMVSKRIQEMGFSYYDNKVQAKDNLSVAL